MMLNITEEQSVNGAFNLITQGASAAKDLHSWLDKRNKEQGTQADIQAQKNADELRADACSYYRGGFVKTAQSLRCRSS